MKVIVSCGICCLDMYCIMKEYPKPNTKTRADSTHIEVGGNASNMLATLNMLSERKWECRLVAKMGEDVFGREVMRLLSNDGINTDFIIQCNTCSTATSHIIVSGEYHGERTIIHVGVKEQLNPKELDMDRLLNNVDLFFMDGRQLNVAAEMVKTLAARPLDSRPKIMLELERIKEMEIFDLLQYCDYVVCSESFIDEYVTQKKLNYTSERKIVDVMINLYNGINHTVLSSFVNVSLGAQGSLILTRRSIATNEECICSLSELLQFMTQDRKLIYASERKTMPIVKIAKVESGEMVFNLVYCTSWNQLPVKDTTCAGDSFHAGLIYSMLSIPESQWDEGKFLQFASIVAAHVCSEIGLRKGLEKFSAHDTIKQIFP